MLQKSETVTLMPIKKMDRALAFYTDKLGAKVNMRGDGDMKDDWASIKVAGHEVWLITPSKREKRTVAYTSFVVKDIKKIVTGLQKKGVKFDSAEDMGPGSKVDGPIAWSPIGGTAFFPDSEGNLLMLYQMGEM